MRVMMLVALAYMLYKNKRLSLLNQLHTVAVFKAFAALVALWYPLRLLLRHRLAADRARTGGPQASDYVDSNRGSQRVVVTTSKGKLVGFKDLSSEVLNFRGVQYAHASRFRKPVEVAPW